MYQTLLGRDGFRKGMDLYFQRHDGQAVECDDFRRAMADANDRDLTQFELWYSQAGTPRVKVETRYEETADTYTVTLTQSCPPTPGQAQKRPYHIPVAIGLLDSGGRDMPLHMEGASGEAPTTAVLELTQESQTFEFVNVTEKPVPSLLRNFSAPVVLEYDYTDAELAFLMAHDSDPFNRWEAGQRLAMRRMLMLTDAVQNDSALTDPELQDAALNDAFRATLNDTALDAAFRELALTLPSESMVAEQVDVVDPHAIHAVRQFLRRSLAEAMRTEWEVAYQSNRTPGTYSPDAVSAGKRGLKNLALVYLAELNDADAHLLAQRQYDSANNMTDRMAALTALVNSSAPGREEALAHFYSEFENEALVIDKWFSLQATARTTDVAAVRKLMEHPAFTLKNPNRARSLIFSFCNGNPAQFHAVDGSGYDFWAEQVIALNALNPQVAARLARSLDRWRKYAPALQQKMQSALKKVASAKSLSKDVLEVVTKSLSN
jgi:aminopeptidase N